MATGDVLAVFRPVQAQLPEATYPTFDRRNGHPVLDFDAGADETCYFEGVYPDYYGSDDLSVEIFWAASTATSGDVVWAVAMENLKENNLDLDADGFGAESTSELDVTTNATSGKVNKSSVAMFHSDAGSPAPGNPFRLRVKREGTSGGDDMVGDAELVRVVLKEG